MVLLTHWAVRRGMLRPSNWWARLIRRASDPLLHPIERRVIAAGGNPQAAPVWLVAIAAVAGLLTITLVRWVLSSIDLLVAMRGARLSEWIWLGVTAVTSLLMAALLVRVIGSWLGLGRYNRWMRPLYVLTDWLVEPIRRKLPPFGPVDLSPILAYLLLLILRDLLFNALH